MDPPKFSAPINMTLNSLPNNNPTVDLNPY